MAKTPIFTGSPPLPLWVGSPPLPAWGEDPCACCPPECIPCPPGNWANFSVALGTSCTGTIGHFTDTSVPPAGCTYHRTIWDVPCGTILEASGRTMRAQMGGSCCDVTVNSSAECAPGCFCEAIKTKQVGSCPCLRNCTSNCLAPSTALGIVSGSSVTIPGAPPGWCESLNGSYVLPELSCGSWGGTFRRPAGFGYQGCIPPRLVLTASLNCNGVIQGTAQVFVKGNDECIWRGIYLAIPPTCVGCSGSATVGPVNWGPPSFFDGPLCSGEMTYTIMI